MIPQLLNSIPFPPRRPSHCVRHLSPLCFQGYVTSECTQPAPSGDVTFTILHTNDVRGRVMPITRWSGDCVLESPTDPTSILERPSEYVGGCHGGVAGKSAVYVL